MEVSKKKILTTFDFENLDKLMGDIKPLEWEANFQKNIPERMVAAYLLRMKGYDTKAVAEKLGTSYNCVCHGVNMVRRAKKITAILDSIGIDYEQII